MIFYGKQKAIEHLEDVLFKHGKVEVNKVKEIKTLSQNAYVWLVATHIGEETGQGKNDIYNFMLANFANKKEVAVCGVISEVIVSLSQMTKDECINFIDNFVVFFRQEGFDVPDPETKRAKEMYNYYKEKGML